MTHLTYTDGHLRVHFSGWEALMVRRREFAAPAAGLTGAEATTGWSSEVLGLRFGLAISGFRKVGTFTHPSGTRRLVSMRRGLPLLRVGLDRDATGFDELLVSTPDAVAVAEAVRTAVAS